jgi:hypothetical protein
MIEEETFRVGFVMIIATGVIQVLAQLALSHMVDILPSPSESRWPRFYMLTHSVTAVVILMAGHILQVVIWAVVYHFDWGVFVTFRSAIYFSLASFTTVGATDLGLPHEYRLIGALEAAAGMLMFGWSTALLVGVVTRSDHRPRP